MIRHLNPYLSQALLVVTYLFFMGCSEVLDTSAEEFVERASAAIENNQPIVANIEAKNALIKQRSNLEARWILANSYLLLREGLAAEVELNKLRDSKFENPALQRSYLKSLLLQGRYNDILEVTTKINPSSEELAMQAAACIALADLSGSPDQRKDRLGYLELAASALAKASLKNSGEPLVHYGYARLAIRSKKFDEAEEHLKRAGQFAAQDVELWILRGTADQLSNNLDEALSHFERAVEVAPYDLLANMNLIRLLIMRHRGDEALDLVVTQRKIHRNLPTLLYLQSLALVQGSELSQAADILNGVVKEYPNYIDAQLLLGRVLTNLGHYGQAEVAVEKVLEFYPDNENVRKLSEKIKLAAAQGDSFGDKLELEKTVTNLLESSIEQGQSGAIDARNMEEQRLAAREFLGSQEEFLEKTTENKGLIVRQLAQRGEYQKIIDLAIAESQTHGAGAAAADWTGLANLLRGDFKSARQFFNLALQREPGYLPALNNLGDLEFRAGNLDAAMRLFNSVLQISQNDGFALLGKARVLLVQGDLDGADALIEKAERDANHAIPAAYVRAESFSFRGDDEAWLDSINALRALNTDSARPHILLANYYTNKKQFEKANNLLQEAIKSNAYDPDIPAVQSNLFVQRGAREIGAQRFAEAIVLYEQALQYKSDNVTALNDLAWLYQQNDDHRALATAKKAYELNPNNSSILDTYGWILYQQGEHEKAESILGTAVELAPEMAEIRYHWAASLAELGETERAKQELGSVLRDPTLTSRADATKLRNRLE